MSRQDLLEALEGAKILKKKKEAKLNSLNAVVDGVRKGHVDASYVKVDAIERDISVCTAELAEVSRDVLAMEAKLRG